jgi:ketol-acid reductoisomerase
MVKGKEIITAETRKNMKKVLEDIQSGAFAREWILENKAGRPVYNAIKEKEENHLVEKVGRELRKMMTWIKKDEE